jgi:UDP-N-acetylmuramate--alanine ligase
LNASAAIEVSKPWKTEAEIFKALEQIKPVRRRFEKVFEGEYTIISDYAHHPTEIRTLIQTVRETLKPKRLLGVFQPHRYTRTKALMADFPPAFQGLEKLWLVPVYAASEKPLEGGTTEDLVRSFPVEGAPEVKNLNSLEKAWHDIIGVLEAGDVLLIIGAGDIEQLAEWARR